MSRRLPNGTHPTKRRAPLKREPNPQGSKAIRMLAEGGLMLIMFPSIYDKEALS